ncbi:hypothetical protein [Erwinia rhapontici]|uniref:hypothetical protein n=1 Tax=Erwinia rhapontici TaxID=55212 RepID=UPI00105DB4AE|nr:hypothetical protein [Erwinia rhapontici]TDS90411.1 hypothetical protein EDF84_1144 [Erwinia rhapontici]
MVWAEVVDSAVKIGLGAAIAALASYFTLDRTYEHELNKDNILLHRQLTERKRILYVDYLTTAHILTQKYRDVQGTADGDDYFSYLKLYHELQIVAEDPLRICAYNLLNAVNEFICFHKADRNAEDRELFRTMRGKIDEEIGKFQYLAKQDIDGPVPVE